MKQTLNKQSVLVGMSLLLLLSACNKTEPLPPVDISKLAPIPESELKVIEDYIKALNDTYTPINQYSSDSKKSYFFDQKERVIIVVETHLKPSTEADFKEYTKKKYNDDFKLRAITSFCERRESRSQGKIKLKNHISTKYVEQDKDGKELYHWTISPSEYCQPELKKLGIQYPQ